MAGGSRPAPKPAPAGLAESIAEVLRRSGATTPEQAGAVLAAVFTEAAGAAARAVAAEGDR